MKRNDTTNRLVRRSKRTRGQSRYAEKLMSGKMMYGPGCCGHTIPREKIEARKEQARKEGHFGPYRGPFMGGEQHG